MNIEGIGLTVVAVILFLVGIETLDLYFTRESSPILKLFLAFALIACALACFVFAIAV